MAEKEHDMDDLFRSKLKDLESDPLPSSWDKINSALESTVPAPTHKPSFIHKYWMAAALGVVVLTAMWVSYQAFCTSQLTHEQGMVSLDVKQNRDNGTASIDTTGTNSASKNIDQSTAVPNAHGIVYQDIDTLKRITLPDGTIVALHKKSVLALDRNFPEVRTVSLQGKAFFEVKKGNKPFLLATSHAELRLDEGAFVAITYPKLQVFVKSGRIILPTKQAEKALSAGERLSYSKGQLPVVSPILSPNYLSWQTGKLVFDNTHLDQVVSDIESYYGVGIALDNEALKNCRFTGVFEKTSLEEVLQVLSASFDLKYNQKDGRYMIHGVGCK